MSTPDLDHLVTEIHAERTRLTDLLTGLDPDQWSAPSLCQGWRVREVVAHITMPFRLSAPRFLGGMIHARFDFDRFADRDAHRTAARMTDADLVAVLRANVTPPGSLRVVVAWAR